MHRITQRRDADKTPLKYDRFEGHKAIENVAGGLNMELEVRVR